MSNSLKKYSSLLLSIIINRIKTNNSDTYRNVFYDFLLGITYWRIWYILGIKEIKLRYKRSSLGQLWHVLSTGIQISFMGVVWAYLFKMPVREFFPYFAVSKIIYEYMSNIISYGSKYYFTEGAFLKEIASPKSVIAFANATRGAAVFLHNAVIGVIVMILFQTSINLNIIYLIPSILLIFINSIWVTIFLGYLGARFRDLPPLIDSLLSMIVMITPVFWKPTMLPEYLQKYLVLNPFYVFIKISRDSVFGLPPDLTYWTAAIIITIGGFFISFVLLKKNLHRISFWV